MKKYTIKYSSEVHYSGTFGPYKMMEDLWEDIEAKNLQDIIKKLRDKMINRTSRIYANQKGRDFVIQEIFLNDKLIYRASDSELDALENKRDGRNFLITLRFHQLSKK